MPGFHPVDPKQSFPDMEKRITERWKEDDVFKRSLEQRAYADIWSFYEGPPTANGALPASRAVPPHDIYPRYRHAGSG
jgi:isoleucyl-tRNA synthetase